MERLPTRLDGPILIKPVVHGDARGFFHESYRRNVYGELGIPEELVQENHSRSQRGIVRGMHYQPGMSKLVRCPSGAVVDVVADLRRGSPTYGKWEAFELNGDNLLQLYVPDGFAHGFCALSEVADVVYKCGSYYDPELEGGIHYADPDLAIAWPEGLELTCSPRDASAPLLREVADALPFEYAK